MRTTLHLLKVVTILLLGALLSAAPQHRTALAGQGALHIVYPEFWPFFVRQDNGEMSGFFFEIVNTALEEMEIRAVWTTYPWKRCQANVQNGKSAAMITFPSAERLKYTVTHKDPFYLKELKVFTYTGHPQLDLIEKIQTLDDIRAAGLLVITYAGNGWADTNIATRGIEVYTTPQLPNVWRMLALKRGDIVIEWPPAAWPDIYQVGVEKVVVETDVRVESMPFHLMIGKNSPYAGRMKEFNTIIRRMRKDGTIERIVRSYTNLPATEAP